MNQIFNQAFNFNFSELQEEEAGLESPTMFEKVNNFPETRAYEETEELLNLKSVRKTSIKNQISFQNCFMTEHSAVFLQKIQNYIEFCQQTITKFKLPSFDLFKINQEPSIDSPSAYDLLTQSDISSVSQLNQKFIKALPKEDKLSEFLSIVSGTCSEQITIELCLLAQKIWEQFTSMQIYEPESEQLITLAKKISKNHKINLKYLNFGFLNLPESNFNAEMQQRLNDLLQPFCVTVILVTAQYFQNPYTKIQKENSFKRRFNDLGDCQSDQQFDFQICPRKIRKCSFSF